MNARAPRLAAALLLAIATTSTFAAGGGGYLQTNLVSDDTTLIHAAHQDPQLVNAWGIAFSATSPIWVSDNATGLATVYDGSGNLNNTIAAVIPGFSANPGTPTGAVFNGNNASFQITDGTNTRGANFLFVTEDGTLDAWNSNVGQPATGIKNHAFQVVNNNPNAVYKGLAIDSPTAGTRLYAANFRAGTIDTFGPTFAPVSLGRPPPSPSPLSPRASRPSTSRTSAETSSSPTPCRTPPNTMKSPASASAASLNSTPTAT